jgi:hypothetical protein
MSKDCAPWVASAYALLGHFGEREYSGPPLSSLLSDEFSLVQVAGTAGLGVWQSKRYVWKVEQVDLRKAALRNNPEPLPG